MNNYYNIHSYYYYLIYLGFSITLSIYLLSFNYFEKLSIKIDNSLNKILELIGNTDQDQFNNLLQRINDGEQNITLRIGENSIIQTSKFFNKKNYFNIEKTKFDNNFCKSISFLFSLFVL
mgnify:CR=1 FL=1